MFHYKGNKYVYCDSVNSTNLIDLKLEDNLLVVVESLWNFFYIYTKKLNTISYLGISAAWHQNHPCWEIKNLRFFHFHLL